MHDDLVGGLLLANPAAALGTVVVANGCAGCIGLSVAYAAAAGDVDDVVAGMCII